MRNSSGRAIGKPSGPRHSPGRSQGSWLTTSTESCVTARSSSHVVHPQASAWRNAGREFSGKRARAPRWPWRSNCAVTRLDTDSASPKRMHCSRGRIFESIPEVRAPIPWTCIAFPIFCRRHVESARRVAVARALGRAVGGLRFASVICTGGQSLRGCGARPTGGGGRLNRWPPASGVRRSTRGRESPRRGVGRTRGPLSHPRSA
jgi:hypothetical protein